MDDAEVRRVNLLEVLAEEFPHVPPLPATLAGAWTEEKLRAFHTTAPAAHVARQQAQLQCDVRVAGPQGQLQCDVVRAGSMPACTCTLPHASVDGGVGGVVAGHGRRCGCGGTPGGGAVAPTPAHGYVRLPLASIPPSACRYHLSHRVRRWRYSDSRNSCES
jgi:hypothetical protein